MNEFLLLAEVMLYVAVSYGPGNPNAGATHVCLGGHDTTLTSCGNFASNASAGMAFSRRPNS
jgi:hypothetical protein